MVNWRRSGSHQDCAAPTRLSQASSSMISTPSSRALASFEPASAPATSRSVFFETEPATLAPRRSAMALASSRVIFSQRAGEDHGLARDRAVALRPPPSASMRHLRQQRVERLPRCAPRAKKSATASATTVADPVDVVDPLARLALRRRLRAPPRARPRTSRNERASRCALVSPTWRMPSAKMNRFERDLAPRLDGGEQVAHRGLAVAFAVLRAASALRRRAPAA